MFKIGFLLFCLFPSWSLFSQEKGLQELLKEDHSVEKSLPSLMNQGSEDEESEKKQEESISNSAKTFEQGQITENDTVEEETGVISVDKGDDGQIDSSTGDEEDQSSRSPASDTEASVQKENVEPKVDLEGELVQSQGGEASLDLNNKVDEMASEVKALPKKTTKRSKKLKKTKKKVVRKSKSGDVFIDYMFFPPEKNEVTVLNQSIEYSMQRADELRVGPDAFFSKEVTMRLSYKKEGGTAKPYLHFRWPKSFIDRGGALEIISNLNESLWRTALDDVDYEDWESLVSKKGIKKRSNYGLFDSELEGHPVWGQVGKSLRFCIRKKGVEDHLVICSGFYDVMQSKKSGRVYLELVKKNTEAKIVINDTKVTNVGTTIFRDKTQKIKFRAIMENGVYFQFISGPKKVELVDMVYDKTKDKVLVTGQGTEPFKKKIVYGNKTPQTLSSILNLSPTIGDFRKFWMIELSPKEKSFYIRSEVGVPFKIGFYYSELPQVEDRVYLKRRDYNSSYGTQTKIYGLRPDGGEMESIDGKVKNENDLNFSWTAPVKEKGKYNRSYLKLKYDDGKEWSAFWDVYKGFANDFSLRLTGVLAELGDFVFMGEISYVRWFESLMGWENFTFSEQRWGVSLRYFQSVYGTLTNKIDPPVTEFSSLVFDLKYRFNKGVWGKDPTTGMMLSYQKVGIGQFDYSLLGGGVFWARSMPKFFDVIMNIIPWFRYPKWVDLEFIYYPMTLDSSYEISLNYALNFHGKIDWPGSWFGEAGFGMKQYSFTELESFKVANIYTIYATVGLGYSF